MISAFSSGIFVSLFFVIFKPQDAALCPWEDTPLSLLGSGVASRGSGTPPVLGTALGPSGQEGHGGAGASPGKGTELGMELEHQEGLRELERGSAWRKGGAGGTLWLCTTPDRRGQQGTGTGGEGTASGWAREDLIWILGKMSSWKGWSDIGMG